jgi:hypothetical protein
MKFNHSVSVFKKIHTNIKMALQNLQLSTKPSSSESVTYSEHSYLQMGRHDKSDWHINFFKNLKLSFKMEYIQ